MIDHTFPSSETGGAENIRIGGTLRDGANVVFLKNVVQTDAFTGFLIADEGYFFEVTCPCGVIARFSVNGFPEMDMRHPCGHPEHWSVRYQSCLPNATNQQPPRSAASDLLGASTTEKNELRYQLHRIPA